MPKRRYKNKAHRAMHDMNWDWSDDDYDYLEPDKKFRRNKIDGMLGGVCAGIGDHIGIDPIIVRIITVVSFFFTGFTLLIYGLLWLCVPSDKRAPYIREVRETIRAKRKNASTETETVRTTSFKDVKSKYRSLETRLQDLERSITSKEWQLRREFKDLEN